jgi:hypothetical protein
MLKQTDSFVTTGGGFGWPAKPKRALKRRKPSPSRQLAGTP